MKKKNMKNTKISEIKPIKLFKNWLCHILFVVGGLGKFIRQILFILFQAQLWL